MSTYTVRSGDSLSRIAMRNFGTAARWREIADLNGIPDPSRIRVGQVLVLPQEETPEKSTRREDVIITEEGKRVFYRYAGSAAKRELGKKFKKGLFRIGKQSPEEFLEANGRYLARLKLSKSEVSALLATSENEGNLDAVNTWDNSFMSFGMFQWTLGARGDKGELPALMKRVQQEFPDAFEQYAGQFGVRVSADTDGRYGYLIHNGKKIDTAAEKGFFRSHSSAYRFAIAGTDKRVNAVQVLHAISRFDWFFFNTEAKLGGYRLCDLLTSEYAASLLLDNHVNRPGYVLPCVARAAQQTGRTFRQLAEGSDADESRLIKQYLAVRESYGRSPMTHAAQRALVTKKYVDTGRISAKRGSFKSNSDRR
ncbi:MAG: LysM peptidoglycan-binding domain-containing protein [Pseudomonadota bacterium]